jgi:uncharacterized membrane protein
MKENEEIQRSKKLENIGILLIIVVGIILLMQIEFNLRFVISIYFMLMLLFIGLSNHDEKIYYLKEEIKKLKDK